MNAAGKRRFGRTRLVAVVAAGLLVAATAAASATPASAETPKGANLPGHDYPKPDGDELGSGAPAGPSDNTLRSIPASPEPVVLLQPDGASFSAVPWGIATFNGYEDTNGFGIAQDEAGVWRYIAARDASGGVVLSDARPDSGAPPAGVDPHLRPETPPESELYPPAGATPTEAPHTPFKGNSPALVILAQFPDQASVGTPASYWATQYFGTSGRSVRDYYEENSFDQLHVVPVSETNGTTNDGIVGWVTLPSNHPNTGSVNTTGDATAAHTTVRDAIQAADPYVNFASYDTDGDGAVETTELHITVITAGYESSYGGESVQCGKQMWGHRWAIGGYGITAPTVDGKVAGGSGYMMFGEQHCNNTAPPGHPATMGIMTHELGHDFNLPDLYDTDGSSEGIGKWSLMAGGSWNTVAGEFIGAVPAGLDPFSKTYQDWITPTQAAGSGVAVPLAQVETNQRVVRLLDNPNGIDWNFGSQSGTGEYFLLENRQKVGYDAGIPGCGVLIWHIDETRTSSNSANATESRKLVDLEEADGFADLDSGFNRGDDGDPYPGSSNNTSFAAATNPNSNLYSGSASGVSVTVPAGACAASTTVTVTAPGTPSPGLLRVTSTPAVPTQIKVDGNIADTWGLQWLKLPPGSHQVCFGAVAGFTTPSCQDATVSSGVTTSVNGAFTARGYLKVVTSPAVASQISVDGIPRNNWGLYTDLPTGNHQVCFGAVAGFTPPSCQTVAVNAGATTEVTGTFTASSGTALAGVGLLRVTTSPALPSQILVDGNIADTWGLNWLQIAPGSHQVCFTRVEGWTEPSCSTVSVSAGATTTLQGTFTQRGYLKVVTSPPVAGTISVDGHPANDWGVFTDLPTGSHQVCFGAVPGKSTPACNTQNVTAGATTLITGAYT